MSNQSMTNWLLLGILMMLTAQLFIQQGGREVLADTFRLDDCITASIGDRPVSYVHVVSHSQAPSH